jgi:hypothetical protein
LVDSWLFFSLFLSNERIIGDWREWFGIWIEWVSSSVRNNGKEAQLHLRCFCFWIVREQEEIKEWFSVVYKQEWNLRHIRKISQWWIPAYSVHTSNWTATVGPTVRASTTFCKCINKTVNCRGMLQIIVDFRWSSCLQYAGPVRQLFAKSSCTYSTVSSTVAVQLEVCTLYAGIRHCRIFPIWRKYNWTCSLLFIHNTRSLFYFLLFSHYSETKTT